MIRVCCAVVIKENKILAVQRNEQMSHPLKWEFPGGKIQEGESEEECIHRELLEELQLPISIIKRLPPIEHQYGDKRIELIPFIVSSIDIPVLLEHKSLKWLNPEELLQPDWVEADIHVISGLKQEWKFD